MRRQFQAAVPARVAAAQDYLRFAEVAKCGGPAAMNADPSVVPTRDLTTHEQAVYDGALEVLRLYFTGEMDYGSPTTRPDPNDLPDDDDEPPPTRHLTETE